MQPTEQQMGIIQANSQHRILVHAGPGTGKTEVVARRLSYLLGIEHLTPGQILVLSFSRAAVKALIQRINLLSETDKGSIEDLRYLSVRTFDSWSFRMLRFLGEEPANLLRISYEENIALLIKRLSLIPREELLGKQDLRLARIRHIIVDECQDLTGVRAKLVQILLDKLVPASPLLNDQHRCGFTVLGDPNQAIYGWTLNKSQATDQMTSQQLMSWLRETYGSDLKTQPLNINHRATSGLCDLVVKAAEILTECERDCSDPRPALRKLISSRTNWEDTEEVIQDIQYSTSNSRLAILCRDNSQIINLQNELRKKLAPAQYSRISVTAGDPPRLLPSWIAAMLYQFQTDALSRGNFFKIFNYLASSDHFSPPCNGDPEATWQMLMKFAKQDADNTSISMEALRTRLNWPDSLPDDVGFDNDSILITTIHQSKGLEFERVKLVDRGGEHGETDVWEEGRVLFVAISRARQELSVLEMPGSHQFYPKEFNRGERTRWHRSAKNGMNLLEIGQTTDIDLESIVQVDVQGSETKVKEIQNFLTEHERKLKGAEVILKKTPLPNVERRFVYTIILQFSQDQELLLGQTTQTLTADIVSLMEYGQKIRLPEQIKGLAIRGVTTIALPSLKSGSIPSPWNASRLWLGIDIHGIGTFRLA